MALTGDRTFVGFGFGAIQAGLFLYEAHAAGTFGRLVCAEVQADRVARVRAAGGVFTVNTAHADRIEQVSVGPVQLLNPNEPSDRAALVDAVATAHEIATALPSVAAYADVALILAAGLTAKRATAGPPALVYCAENATQAARQLQAQVAAGLVEGEDDRAMTGACFVDTVIGKMSGVVPATVDLAPVVPGDPDAFLVEAFNRILVSSHSADHGDGRSCTRGIPVFLEKVDLAPFEAAKLFCHNAGHATAAYLARAAGLTTMDQLAGRPDLLAVVRRAMVDEAGAALVHRYAGADALFTPTAMAAYADDLLARMVNPFLRDGVARVTRDPARKLGWDDRLVGAMRLALTANIQPRALALGASAALLLLAGAVDDPDARLRRLWADETGEVATQCSGMIAAAYASLIAWQAHNAEPPLTLPL